MFSQFRHLAVKYIVLCKVNTEQDKMLLVEISLHGNSIKILNSNHATYTQFSITYLKREMAQARLLSQIFIYYILL